MKRWLVRAWRCRVEVRPVPNLLFYAAGGAASMWVSDGVLRAVQTGLFVVIVGGAVVALAAFASARRP